jgi:SAM-dependent methyltransferase
MASDGPAGDETREQHWNAVYEHKGAPGVSWYQPVPKTSLAIIDGLELAKDAPIIDVGGGASRLAASLLAQGYTDLTVLDISARALELSQAELGADARRVQWLRADLLAWSPPRPYGLWHDRAVFHFLVDAPTRQRYVDLLHAGLAQGGLVVIGTFALDGPERCSELPVVRYDAARIGEVLGEGFVLIDERREEHRAPSGGVQPFTWATFRRRSGSQ